MNYEKELYEISDAFILLRDSDVDDDAAAEMLKANRITEGKSFGIASSTDMAAAKSFLEEDAQEDVIQVIDVDADSVDHIKTQTSYIGQAILCCNRCKANRFMNIDELVADEYDPELYNEEDECPHCHDAGAGFSLIGQVGKIAAEKEEEPAEAEVETEETVDIENELATDEAAIENDLETGETSIEEPVEEEQPAEEEDIDVDTLETEEEPDGMETETSEEELDDLDLPDLGDEFDPDMALEEEEEVVEEALEAAPEMNKYAKEAWMMNQVIAAMNDEGAYYGSWLYLWPDGETEEECAYDFGTREAFEELEETFLKTYKYYHNGGLYDASPDVVRYAHSVDSKLGLHPIENIERVAVTESVSEPICCKDLSDVLKLIVEPDHIERVVVTDCSAEPARLVYDGCAAELPTAIVRSACNGFDVADGHLVCNIETDCSSDANLSSALQSFDDTETEMISLWDAATGHVVYNGTKEGACKEFGNCRFVSIEVPAVLCIKIVNPEVATLECDEQTELEALVSKVLAANGLSEFHKDDARNDAYWVNQSICCGDDLDLIYDRYVKATGETDLIKEFKRITGYSPAEEAAFEAGYAAAKAEMEAAAKAEVVDEDDVQIEEIPASLVKEAFFVRQDLPDAIDMIYDEVREKLEKEGYDTHSPEARSAIEAWVEYIADSGYPTYSVEEWFEETKTNYPEELAELPRLNEQIVETYMTREQQIAALEQAGRHYTWKKYTDAQIYRMYQRYVLSNTQVATPVAPASEETTVAPVEATTCEQCGAHLNDSGTCPVCDHGEVELESFTPYRNRRELAEAILECKNNNRPYSVRRSVVEGFRYDLILEADQQEIEAAAKPVDPGMTKELPRDDANNTKAAGTKGSSEQDRFHAKVDIEAKDEAEAKLADEINKMADADYETFVKLLAKDAKSQAFIEYLRDHYKLGDDTLGAVKKSQAHETVVKCSELIPTQSNISMKKSLSMIADNPPKWALEIINTPLTAFNDPTITYAGKYIIDGHHRWSKAFALNGGDCEIKVLDFPAVPDVTVEDMLKATQLAIVYKKPDAKLSNPVGGGNDKNLLTASADEVASYVEPIISDAVVDALIEKGRGTDKTSCCQQIGANCVEMHGKVLPNAPDREFMPQTDKSKGSVDLMKQAVVDLTETLEDPSAESADTLAVISGQENALSALSAEEQEILSEISRVAIDTTNAIKHMYGIEGDPAIVVADILQDLRLISGAIDVSDLPDTLVNRATIEMYQDYTAFHDFMDELLTEVTGHDFHTTPAMRLTQAIRMLKAPQFSTEGIYKAIGSPAFLQAAARGAVPYIDAATPLALPEGLTEVCEECGCSPCECVLGEFVDFDSEQFDADVNRYFDEAYENTVIYNTDHGHIKPDGTIILEGYVRMDAQIQPIIFTLTPACQINESAEPTAEMLQETLGKSFTVTNNLSSEKFELTLN